MLDTQADVYAAGRDGAKLPEKGAARAWALFREQFWNIMKLNFCFLLCCFPIFTVGVAVAALSKIYYKIYQDEYVSPVSDFFHSFKELFAQTWAVSVVVPSLEGALALTILLCLRYIAGQPFLYGVVALCITLLIFLMLASVYLFQMIAIIDLPVRVLVKNSVLVAFAYFPRSALAAALLYGLLAAIFAGFPNSFIFVILGCFPLALFFANYLTQSGIGRCIALRQSEEEQIYGSRGSAGSKL